MKTMLVEVNRSLWQNEMVTMGVCGKPGMPKQCGTVLFWQHSSADNLHWSLLFACFMLVHLDHYDVLD